MSEAKQAKVVWTGEELNFDGISGSGYTFGVSGSDHEQGASPMEYLLAGLAGCTAVDVVNMLKKQRQKVTGVDVKAVGVRADEHPKVYTRVTVTYIIRGKDVDPKAVERAIALSKEKYCSASIMFARSGAKMETEVKIEEEGIG